MVCKSEEESFQMQNMHCNLDNKRECFGCCSGSDDGSLVRRDAKLKTPLLCSSALNLSFAPNVLLSKGCWSKSSRWYTQKMEEEVESKILFVPISVVVFQWTAGDLNLMDFALPATASLMIMGKRRRQRRNQKVFSLFQSRSSLLPRRIAPSLSLTKIKCFRQSTLGFPCGTQIPVQV